LPREIIRRSYTSSSGGSFSRQLVTICEGFKSGTRAKSVATLRGVRLLVSSSSGRKRWLKPLRDWFWSCWRT
jgi:hypothetical protein